MDFIATYWWVWLIGMFACFAVAMFNQINRIRRMHRADFDTDHFTKGLTSFIVSGLAGSVFGILFLIGLIIQLINYAKG